MFQWFFCLFVFLGKHFQGKEIEENRIGQEKKKQKTEPEYGSDSTGNRGGQIVQPSHFLLMRVSQGSGRLPLGGVGGHSLLGEAAPVCVMASH